MSVYRPCSKCTSSRVGRLKYTWWGGLLGPRLLTHVKCHDCGHRYNGKTGRSNTRPIIAYTLIVGSLAAVLAYLAFSNIDYSSPSGKGFRPASSEQLPTSAVKPQSQFRLG